MIDVIEKLERSANSELIKKEGGAFNKALGEINSAGLENSKEYIKAKIPQLVSGYGMHKPRGVVAETDPNVLASVEQLATNTFTESLKKSVSNPTKTYSKMATEIAGPLQGMYNAYNQPFISGFNSLAKQLGKGINKSIGLTSPLSSGFVPFDLIPFARTIYPYYTPIRNKTARVPGKGTYHRAKIISEISGSFTQLGNLPDDSTSEFFSASGGFNTYPNPLPKSGTQTGYDVVIPYQFYGLTEGASWLAQFAGEGFDDAFGLASLILIQEFMQLEEHDMLASTQVPLTTPTFTIAARTGGSNETPLSGVTGSTVWVTVAGVNYWGQTASATLASATVTASSVIDVTITPQAGGQLAYAIYTGTGSAAPTASSMFQFTYNTQAGFVGGVKFTLQGALPTSGANPSATDTGTHASTRSESLLSVLSGLAQTSASTGYQTGATAAESAQAGYTNLATGQTLSIDLLNTALLEMFNGTNGFYANPQEIVSSANDITNLSNSIVTANNTAYLLQVNQNEVAGFKAGAAVSSVVNPVTRAVPELLVHPFLPQGTAMLLSYTLPQTQNNLGNGFEMVMVQDVATIAWPVIDPTFRTSALRYGTFFCGAPQYQGLIQGLQNSTTTPYS